MKLIHTEVQVLGDASKVFVGGFSQGATVTNGVLLHAELPANLAGAVAQSGL